MVLSGKICLCYIGVIDLFSWIKDNNLSEKHFEKERQMWFKEVDKVPNFFSDTELLLVFQEVLLLKVSNEDHASFLAKTYKLEYQAICQKLFSEKKNILLVSNRQWKDQKTEEEVIVLLKDEESIKNSLEKWLKKIIIHE